MDDEFKNIRGPENTQSYFQKNKAVTFSVSVSLILHIILLMVIMNSNTQEKIKSRLKLKAYILKQPLVEIISEEEEKEEKAVDETVEEIIDEKPETLTTSSPDKIETAIKDPPKSLPKLAKSTKSKLNFGKLRSSINNAIEQDSFFIKQAVFEDCEAVKKKTGALDCVSNIERLGFNYTDPYNLSKIFNALDKNPDNKKKERALAKLTSNKKYITAIIDNKQLPGALREQFKEELAYIRGEIHYQDCDGKPNSGTCAGEVDLGKIGQLIGLLFAN